MRRKTIVSIGVLVLGAIAVAVTAIALLVRTGVRAETAAPVVSGVVAAVAAVAGLRKEFVNPENDPKLMPLLHHVSVSVRELDRAVEFYLNVLGLHRVPRPPINFGVDGAWFQLPSGQQLHILVNPAATYRAENTARWNVWDDCHFALRVSHEERRRIFERLEQRKAFITDHPRVNNERYPHFYTLDPDNHVIEINSEPIKPT